MEAMSALSGNSEAALQLLLFVDKRPRSDEKIRQIYDALQRLHKEYAFDLQLVDVSEQPQLAEHFKLVATPTLIKIHPEPRQTLAGSSLLAQLEVWWGRWRQSAEDYQALPPSGEALALPQSGSVHQYSETLKLSDEIFRLQQESEELQAQLQFKERLIAMLAHDLRNPLTAVSIALETLEMGINLGESGGLSSKLTPDILGQVLKHARTQTRAIDRMITDILQASHASGSQLQIQPQRVELGKLCHDVLDRMTSLLKPKRQRVKTDIPSDLPLVFADPERVGQVIANLLDNAIKYTPEGGVIEITALHRTTQKVQVSICDNGPGIPEENRDRIFEDRYRLERDESKEGYGIGLALCQRVVKAHYGQIWVDSEPEQGSCFHFTLPVFR